MEQPATIHDFGGFPKELYEIQYPVSGYPALADEIKREVKTTNIHLDDKWGLDHGAWAVIRHMYPQADVLVLQDNKDEIDIFNDKPVGGSLSMTSIKVG